MQIWQPVHFSRKFSTLLDPGGDGILLRGSEGSSEYGEASGLAHLAQFLPAWASFFAAAQNIAPSDISAAPKERRGIAAFETGLQFELSADTHFFADEAVVDLSLNANSKPIEFFGQLAAQSKHSTQREKSISLPFESAHFALQLRSHMPHETHEDLSIESLKSATFEISPSNAPTGQIVLQ